MRTLNFAKRNFKELVRDPISLVFIIILPLFLLFIFQQFNIPDDNFLLENFTPGIIVFGLSFITLFSANLIASDRSTSLLIRLGTSPMMPHEYILGYTLAILPIILTQNILFFTLAILLGLKFSIHIFLTILISIVISILFIGLGILIGSLVSSKATGGIGSVIVQLVCFTSGMYFDPSITGKVFNNICECLPFKSCLTIIRAFLNNNLSLITIKEIIIFSLYTIIILIIAIYSFKKQMVNDNK